MSMLSNLDLIRRVPLFSLLTADQYTAGPGAAARSPRGADVAMGRAMQDHLLDGATATAIRDSRNPTTSATTSSGTSCGSTASPPRRGTRTAAPGSRCRSS